MSQCERRINAIYRAYENASNNVLVTTTDVAATCAICKLEVVVEALLVVRRLAGG